MTDIGQVPFLCICAEGFAGDTCNATESGQENMFTVYFRSCLCNSNVLETSDCIPLCCFRSV